MGPGGGSRKRGTGGHGDPWKELSHIDYFHGYLPKEEVSDLLKKPGDFLLRLKCGEVDPGSSSSSSKNREILVSVLMEKTESNSMRRRIAVQDIPLGEEASHTEGKKYYFEHAHRFSSPASLIEAYMEKRKGIRPGVYIERPVPRVWWELMDDQVDLSDKAFLGKGEFGEVFSAKMTRKEPKKKEKEKKASRGRDTKSAEHHEEDETGEEEAVEMKVAVKTCTAKEEENWVDFLEEGKIMRPIRHPNIVRLYGFLITQRPIMLVLELMDTTLESLLAAEKIPRTPKANQNRPPNFSNESGPMSFDEKIRVAINISEAMDFVTGKINMVHRDLASRNCLIQTNVLNQRIGKLGDFGLARKMGKDGRYRATGPERLDKSRQSPEALSTGKFGEWTVHSDVWGFGVLLWEMWSAGKKPYSGMPTEVVEMEVKEGRRLRPPANMPVEICHIMLHAWIPRPSQRISFAHLAEDLTSILKGRRARKRQSTPPKGNTSPTPPKGHTVA